MATWGEYADTVLADLFVKGQPAPSAKVLRDAYPFGTREYHPYKVWLARVKAWKAAHAAGQSRPLATRGSAVRHTETKDTLTGDLFSTKR